MGLRTWLRDRIFPQTVYAIIQTDGKDTLFERLAFLCRDEVKAEQMVADLNSEHERDTASTVRYHKRLQSIID